MSFKNIAAYQCTFCTCHRSAPSQFILSKTTLMSQNLQVATGRGLGCHPSVSVMTPDTPTMLTKWHAFMTSVCTHVSTKTLYPCRKAPTDGFNLLHTVDPIIHTTFNQSLLPRHESSPWNHLERRRFAARCLKPSHMKLDFTALPSFALRNPPLIAYVL